ncbi:hypothetical protein ABZZ04_00060 [Streptomyces sp. NPDC006435]|uniref:hypothetical protein n=1 Tax=Streptomyces sp. NPDC006435 TaxID=3154300 RepID=UPI0033BA3037
MAEQYPSPDARVRSNRSLMLLAGTVQGVAALGAAPFAWLVMDVGRVWVVLLAAVWAPLGSLVAVMIFLLAFRRLPPVHPGERTATVTGTTVVPTTENGDELVAVEVDTGIERFTSLIADRVHEDHLARFATGTRWQVLEFVGDRSRVVLASAHDDVLRTGYDLGGLRIGAESAGGTGYGSELLAIGFRDRKN